MVQGAQFNTANAAQALQGMQSMGVMGGMRGNGTIPYNQQRFAHAQAQLRPQQTSQQGTLSPQVLDIRKQKNYLWLSSTHLLSPNLTICIFHGLIVIICECMPQQIAKVLFKEHILTGTDQRS